MCWKKKKEKKKKKRGTLFPSFSKNPQQMSNCYDAYVSADGKADYLLPSAAFTAGKLRVFVQPGVYNESTNVVIPAGGSMTGSNRASTIIDFKSNSASVVISSSFGTVHSTGTVSISNNSSTLTGSTDAFLGLSGSNLFVFLNNRAFAIAEVKDNETIVLTASYQGSALTNATYKVLPMTSYSWLRDITIRNSATDGLVLSGARQASVYNVTIESCGTSNMYVDNSTECTIQDCEANFCAADGYNVVASSCCQFRGGNLLSNAGYGFQSDADCAYLVVTSMHASANSTNFRLFGNNNCLSQSTGDHANVNGLDVDGETSKIVGCAFNNSGVDNVHVLSTALSAILVAVNFNGAGSSEFNNESATTQYAGTYP